MQTRLKLNGNNTRAAKFGQKERVFDLIGGKAFCIISVELRMTPAKNIYEVE